LDAAGFFRLPEEVALRLLGQAVGHAGSEGPVELGKLEALHAALRARRNNDSPLRRTLAGAMISCEGGLIVVERAPPRRSARDRTWDRVSGRRISALTKSEHGAGRMGEGRVK
jgi:tRNA(Ile)-lysidine synthase